MLISTTMCKKERKERKKRKRNERRVGMILPGWMLCAPKLYLIKMV